MQKAKKNSHDHATTTNEDHEIPFNPINGVLACGWFTLFLFCVKMLVNLALKVFVYATEPQKKY